MAKLNSKKRKNCALMKKKSLVGSTSGANTIKEFSPGNGKAVVLRKNCKPLITKNCTIHELQPNPLKRVMQMQWPLSAPLTIILLRVSQIWKHSWKSRDMVVIFALLYTTLK